MLPACCSSCVKFIFRNLTLCTVLEKSRLPSHSIRQIWPDTSITRNHSIFSVLSAHTQNWWSRLNFKFCQRLYHLTIHRALLTGKQIQNGTYQQSYNISMQPHLCSTKIETVLKNVHTMWSNLPYKTLDGHAVHIVPIEFWTKLA